MCSGHLSSRCSRQSYRALNSSPNIDLSYFQHVYDNYQLVRLQQYSTQIVAFSAYLILCLYLEPEGCRMRQTAYCAGSGVGKQIRPCSPICYSSNNFLNHMSPLKPYNDELHLEPKSQASAGNSLN
jgi:hypothetical protein